MPVELFGRVGVVEDFDSDRAAFLKAQQRSRELAIVRGDRDEAFGSDFYDRVLDVQHVVGRSRFRLSGEGVASDRV